MSENIIPEQAAQELVSDVDQMEVEHKIVPSEVKEMAENLADKTLAELSEIFSNLKDDAEAMTRSKEAEAIKSAFYKLLLKLRSETSQESADPTATNPLDVVEENFKALYADYKKARAEYNRKIDEQRSENLVAKRAVLEDLKKMVEAQDEGAAFPALREIQNRWREIGPVPATEFRELNDNYQFYIEQFYDKIKINRDLRDLDFKKNLEAKEAFCAMAEKLAENENVVDAFNELQKLHEQWKEYGPVAKEMREDIWNRFKAATSVINKKYQAHFEEIKSKQQENLALKTALCEKIEELVSSVLETGESDSNKWNSCTKQIEELQKQWRAIGYATPKENQKIYERFRASCDAFFGKKREFYNQYKGEMEENLRRKMEIIEAVEALKDSTEWKKTTDQIIALQKQWKEVGAVPRKKSEQLWTRFRSACDAFFERREKENVRPERSRQDTRRGRGPQEGRAPRALSPKQQLIQKYNALQQEITTYENNMGFFSASKNSSALLEQMQQKIDASKAELKNLEEQIRKASAAEEE